MTGTDIEKLDAVLRAHPKARHALIPLLQEAQAAFGYLPPEVLERVAGHANVPPSTVYGVATFYAQFYLTRQGRHNVKVCRGTACHVRGSAKLMSSSERRLGIKAGETTLDYEFSLERVACLGSCALAPVIVVDGKVHGLMNGPKTEQLFASLLKQSGKAPSASGA